MQQDDEKKAKRAFGRSWDILLSYLSFPPSRDHIQRSRTCSLFRRYEVGPKACAAKRIRHMISHTSISFFLLRHEYVLEEQRCDIPNVVRCIMSSCRRSCRSRTLNSDAKHLSGIFRPFLRDPPIRSCSFDSTALSHHRLSRPQRRLPQAHSAVSQLQRHPP